MCAQAELLILMHLRFDVKEISDCQTPHILYICIGTLISCTAIVTQNTACTILTEASLCVQQLLLNIHYTLLQNWNYFALD